MQRSIALSIVGLFLSLSFSTKAQQTDKGPTYLEFDLPPAIWLTPAEQQQLKIEHSPDKEAVLTDFRALAEHALKRRPNPSDSIFYEGLVSNHPRRLQAAEYLEDMRLLHALVWTYLFTGEQKYARRARSYLLAWASTYRPTGNDVNENKLNPCFLTYGVLKDELPLKKQKEVERWLMDIADQQKQGWRLGETAGNRHAKRLRLIWILGLALEDRDLQEFAFSRSREVLRKALFSDGRSHDLERRDAMHYHVSCINGLLELSLIARISNINLYAETTPEGASIQKSVDYTLPYVHGEKIHPEWTNSQVALDHRRGASGDPYYRPGKPWDPVEAIDMLLMASVYDPELRTLADRLRNEQETSEERFLAYLASFLAEVK